MSRKLCALPLFALLAGCAALQLPDGSPQEPIATPADSMEAVTTARELATQERWQAALDLIDEALTAGKDVAVLEAERNVLETQFAAWKQLLNDRIMIGDAENQHAKITLLDQLSRNSPNDLLIASRRLYAKELLRTRAPALTECAERYVEIEPVLAKRCYQLAADTGQDEALEARLAQVRDQIKAGEQLAEERDRLRAEKARQQRAKKLLQRARAAIDAGDYRKALNILGELAKLQPDNPEIDALERTAWSMLSPQVEALVRLGDHLYLDEQLVAAIATWRAALSLKPGDEEIVARITRAQTVLKRLDDLRDKQRAPVVESPSPS